MRFQLKRPPAHRAEAELPDKNIPHKKYFNVEKSKKNDHT